MNEILFELAVIVALIILNGLFSMSELALVSARRTKLQSEADEGSKRARKALDLAENPTTMLSTVQLGITVIGIFAGVYGGATLAERLAEWFRRSDTLVTFAEPLAFGLVVTVITVLSLIVGELFPKRLALAYPETISKAVAQPLGVFLRFASPIVGILEAAVEVLRKLFRIPEQQQHEVTEEEIRTVVDLAAASGTLDGTEQDIMHRVFKLSDRSVSTVMTPRPQVTSVRSSFTADEVLGVMKEDKHFYYPVIDDETDDCLGLIPAVDFATRVIAGEGSNWLSILQPVLRVPELLKLVNLLEEFQSSGETCAIVIDEHGAISGLVTLYDVVQVIIGDVGQDTEEGTVRKREDGSFLVDASVHVEDFIEATALDITLPNMNGAYHSLGGFVFSHLGHVPTEGEYFEWEGVRFEVVDMDRFKIDKVLVTPAKVAATAAR